MDEKIRAQLLQINRLFYREFAGQFAATRRRLQPGVRQALEMIAPAERVLDLGCGNGEFGRALAQAGHRGGYVGVDFSAGLLEEAQKGLPADFPAQFVRADLTERDWAQEFQGEVFDTATLFAVLHHIPGQKHRARLLQDINRLLPVGGRLILSNWQFLKSARLRQRIVNWEEAGLKEGDVEEGDYLLDWRRGGQGLRYVHHFSIEELFGLATQSGFIPVSSFESDGQGGNLSFYQHWKKS